MINILYNHLPLQPTPPHLCCYLEGRSRRYLNQSSKNSTANPFSNFNICTQIKPAKCRISSLSTPRTLLLVSSNLSLPVLSQARWVKLTISTAAGPYVGHLSWCYVNASNRSSPKLSQPPALSTALGRFHATQPEQSSPSTPPQSPRWLSSALKTLPLFWPLVALRCQRSLRSIFSWQTWIISQKWMASMRSSSCRSQQGAVLRYTNYQKECQLRSNALLWYKCSALVEGCSRLPIAWKAKSLPMAAQRSHISHVFSRSTCQIKKLL